MSINLLTDDPYKHVLALCRRAQALTFSQFLREQSFDSS